MLNPINAFSDNPPSITRRVKTWTKFFDRPVITRKINANALRLSPISPIIICSFAPGKRRKVNNIPITHTELEIENICVGILTAWLSIFINRSPKRK